VVFSSVRDGSGPAGATLACLLAAKGVEVTLFDDGRRPELVVGESLIPAVVPILRKLGLEERVAGLCLRKPGVTFTLNASEKIEFCFESLAGSAMPTYAYNAPRPALDDLLDTRADELGARRVAVRAKIERAGADCLRLAAETLQTMQGPPQISEMPVLDAEGRNAPRLSYRASVPLNPASVMKLVTTSAALDQLVPAFVWTTPVYLEGSVRDGVLNGNLFIRGQGDPKLVVERLWLLLRRVQESRAVAAAEKNGTRALHHAAPGSASSRLPCEEYCEGSETPCTFSRPSAATARHAVTAESMPPLRPSVAELNPHL